MVSKPGICVIDGETLDIIKTTLLTEKCGCYLAKGANGHTVLGYTDTQVFKIKEYDDLKSEIFQSRVHKQLSDETTQYLLKTGQHKMLVNVNKENLEYVMDLC